MWVKIIFLLRNPLLPCFKGGSRSPLDGCKQLVVNKQFLLSHVYSVFVYIHKKILYKLFRSEGKLWSMTHFYHPNFFFKVSSHLSRVAKGTKRFFGFDMISSSLLSFVWDGLSFISFWRGRRYFSICITLFSYSSALVTVTGVLFTAPWDADGKLADWLLLRLVVDWSLRRPLNCCCCWRGGPPRSGKERGWWAGKGTELDEFRVPDAGPNRLIPRTPVLGFPNICPVGPLDPVDPFLIGPGPFSDVGPNNPALTLWE